MTFRWCELALEFYKMNLSTLPIETSDPLNARILDFGGLGFESWNFSGA